MKPAAEVIEDLEFLDESHTGATEAAERLGFNSPAALEKWLERHDAYDLWTSLKNRDPAGTHTSEGRRAAREAAESASRLDAMLATAAKSPLARTRRRGEKIRQQIDELSYILVAERDATAEREAARKEVERLEKQLAEAKAKLRNRPESAVAGPTPIRGTSEYPCRLGCDDVFDTGQGRSAHERRSAAHREQAAS